MRADAARDGAPLIELSATDAHFEAYLAAHVLAVQNLSAAFDEADGFTVFEVGLVSG